MATPNPITTKSKEKNRAFEAAWAELERRHGWRVTEVEVVNPDVANSLLPIVWQDHDNRAAAQFRERFHLAELLAGADEWTSILRLRHFAFTHLRTGSPQFDPLDPRCLVEASLGGARFWCAHYADLFVAAAAAMGFNARHVAIDSDHAESENSTHHGVADVWVNSLRKWVIVDPNYDAHYELDGVPLNAEELGKRWQTHKGAGVQPRVGLESRAVWRANTEIKHGEPEACGYFWHYIHCDGDLHHRRGRTWPNPVIFLRDEAREQKTWYQGQAPKTYKHGRYTDGSFIFTKRVADAYPDLNCVKLVPDEQKKMPFYFPFQLQIGATPNFSHFSISENGGTAMRFEGMEYPWRILPGTCSLEVRAVNAAGHQGPPSRITVRVEEDPNRKGEWPKKSDIK